VLAGVEGDGLLAEVHRGRRAALGADHPRRADARPVARHALVDDHDALAARLAREDAEPAADRAGADDDEVRVLVHGHSLLQAQVPRRDPVARQRS
jgi:hypothetical protein